AVEIQAGLDDLTQSVEVGATVGEHDALGPARRARSVVDRERLLLVLQPAVKRRGGAGREVVLVGVSGSAGVFYAHDLDSGPLSHHRYYEGVEVGVDKESARAAVLQDVADLPCAQARIDGDENAPRRGHG